MIQELQTAKAEIKASLLMSTESSGSRAEKLVNDIATFGRIISNDNMESLSVTINSMNQS